MDDEEVFIYFYSQQKYRILLAILYKVILDSISFSRFYLFILSV